MSGRTVSRRRLVLAIGLVLLAVAGCGSGQPAGPVQTAMSGGKPDFAVASVFTSPGQAGDGGAYLTNSADGVVTLVSASLIPVKGHPTGRLVLLKYSARGDGGEGRGWPVPGIVAGPFQGARVHHGLSSVIFGVAGTRPGENYMTAGLRVVYRYQGHLYTVSVWSAATDCVARNWRTGNVAACHHAENIDRHATERLAGT